MPSADPRQRFQDILDNIALVESYTAGQDETAFMADMKAQDAVKYCLLRIAEAAIKLGAVAEEIAPELPWRAVRGLGNKLRHDYDMIESETIWSIVEKDLPELQLSLQRVLLDLWPNRPAR